MNTSSSMPGYQINEYRLVIPLTEALQEKINSVRTSLHERYRVKASFELQPSLTILKFHAFETIET
jgi:hypothetical protein